MCKVMEDLIQEEKRLERRDLIQKMLDDGMSKEKIMFYFNLSEAEFDEMTAPLAS